MSEGLRDINKLLDLSQEEIKYKIDNISFPAFVFFDNHSDTDILLRDILKDLFSSNYFSREWTITVLNVIDWLGIYKNIVSSRECMKFVIDTGDVVSDMYAVVSAHAINPVNPQNSKLVLEVLYKDGDTQKYVDTKQGKVINILDYPDMPKMLESIYKFNSGKTDYLANHIFNFIKIIHKWLDISDGEFVLESETYQIKTIS